MNSHKIHNRNGDVVAVIQSTLMEQGDDMDRLRIMFADNINLADMEETISSINSYIKDNPFLSSLPLQGLQFHHDDNGFMPLVTRSGTFKGIPEPIMGEIMRIRLNDGQEPFVSRKQLENLIREGNGFTGLIESGFPYSSFPASREQIINKNPIWKQKDNRSPITFGENAIMFYGPDDMLGKSVEFLSATAPDGQAHLNLHSRTPMDRALLPDLKGPEFSQPTDPDVIRNFLIEIRNCMDITEEGIMNDLSQVSSSDISFTIDNVKDAFISTEAQMNGLYRTLRTHPCKDRVMSFSAIINQLAEEAAGRIVDDEIDAEQDMRDHRNMMEALKKASEEFDHRRHQRIRDFLRIYEQTNNQPVHEPETDATTGLPK